MSNKVTTPRLDSRGLDFSNFDEITPQEIEAFRRSYADEDGRPHAGFDYLIEHNPSALKRYRLFATHISPPFRDPRYMANGPGWLAYYGFLDFEDGVRYVVVPMVQAGFTRQQVNESLALSFMLAGPRSLVTITRVLRAYEWPEQVSGAVPWPEEWSVDPDAFSSGVDFSTAQILPGEVEKIVGWYKQTLGEVPTSIRYLARHNQLALKSWRNRYERALITLPKQVLPISFLTAGVLFERKETIRENVLLARACGLSLKEVLVVIDVCAVYGTQRLATAYEAAGDVLDNWS